MSSVPPFDPDRWRALSASLDEALEMTRERRAAWLADLCARDPALGVDLERLLADHDRLRQSPFLEGGAPLLPGSTEPH